MSHFADDETLAMIADLEQKLDAREKQIVMLREALTTYRRACSVDAFAIAESIAVAALDATQDLSGLILCDAEPAAWMRDAGEPSLSTMSHCIPTTVKDIWLKVNPKNVGRYTIPLFKARN